MFFFHDNVFALREGDPLGERLGAVADERGMVLMLCDRCARERGLAERTGESDSGRPLYEARNVVDGTVVGCFPDLYAALDGAGVDHVIT